jgi:hypothetical protein
MSTPWFERDEQLLEELGLALAEEGPNPDRVDMLMAGYDIVMADTLEAALVHDSATDELAAVRSESASARMMTFEGEGFEFEFEVVDGRVVGAIDPPESGVIHLEQPTSSSDGPLTTQVEVDDLGAFEFPLRRPGTFRLRFVAADGRSVATAWIDGPHDTLE